MNRVGLKRDIFACMFGTMVMAGMTAAIMLLLPIFILNEYFTAEYTEIIIIISMALLVFVGTYIAGVLMGEGSGLKPLIAVALYFLVILFLAIFVFGGISPYTLYNVISGAIGSCAAVLLLNKKKKPSFRRKKGSRIVKLYKNKRRVN